MNVSCPNCKASFNAPPGSAGKTARCKRCNERFVIPAVPAPAPSESQQQAIPQIPPLPIPPEVSTGPEVAFEASVFVPGTASTQFRPTRHETKRAYPALRVIMAVCRGFGWIAIIIAVLNFVLPFILHDGSRGGLQSGLQLVSVVYFLMAIAYGVALFAAAESIRVWLDTEANTRRACDIMESVRDAVEYLAITADRK